MRILSNSARVSAGRPILLAYNFSATMSTIYTTYCLGAVASLKLLTIENMTPHFWPYILRHNAWMDQDTTWYGGTPGPRRHCVRWGRSPTERGTTASTFQPIALAGISAGPHFAYNPYCRLGGRLVQTESSSCT